MILRAPLLALALAGFSALAAPASPGDPPPRPAPAPTTVAPDSVTIHRDLWGVPHVYAATEEAGFYGLGWAQAEDQLEWVLGTVLSARGELAATFGTDREAIPTALRAFAPEPVGADYVSRLWRHAEQGRKGLARLSPQLRRNYEAWAAGIRAWRRANPDRVPEWAPDVTAADAVAVSRWLLWLGYQAGIGLADCARGGVRLAAAHEHALEHTRSYASNEWIVAPWRTAENAMMVLSDPHGGTDGTFVYESRIHAGELDAAGFSIGPMLLLMHTADVSWGMTTGSPDVADCYEIETEPGDSLAYRFDGEPRRMETEELVIPVKGGEPVRRTVAYTRHNGVLSPVVAWRDGKAYAVSTAFMDDGGLFDEEVWRINHARSIAEVKRAMELLGMFPQNVMYGDRHGDSWYVRAGKTPVRPDGHDWDRPVPGNTSATAWRGIHPLADLVQVENPAAGFMQNNNIAPDMMLPGSPATADAYPDYIFNDRPGRTNTRGLRAVEVLSDATGFTTADAIELALDEKWYGTEQWQRALRQAVAAGPGDVARMPPGQRRVIRDLLAFDGHGRQESAGALAFVHWQDAVAERLDVEGYRRLEPALWDGAALSDDLAAELVAATADAAASLHARHGGPGATLGDEFRIEHGGRSWPLGGASILPKPVCGSPIQWTRSCMVTLRAHTFSAPDSTGRREVFLGSRLLRLVVFTDPLQSWTLHNYGQSFRAESPHYADQARLSSERALKPVWFRREELMPNVLSTLVLEVEP